MGAPRYKVERFGPLVRGDFVKLQSEQGSFKFLAAVYDNAHYDGEPLWIDLYGGTPYREMLRAVVPDRLKIPTPRQLASQRRTRSNT